MGTLLSAVPKPDTPLNPDPSPKYFTVPPSVAVTIPDTLRPVACKKLLPIR